MDDELKTIVDRALSPLLKRMEGELGTLRGLVGQLTGLRDALARPVERDPLDRAGDDAAELARLIRAHVQWCRRRNANPLKSLASLLRAQMESDDAR